MSFFFEMRDTTACSGLMISCGALVVHILGAMRALGGLNWEEEDLKIDET